MNLFNECKQKYNWILEASCETGKKISLCPSFQVLCLDLPKKTNGFKFTLNTAVIPWKLLKPFLPLLC